MTRWTRGAWVCALVCAVAPMAHAQASSEADRLEAKVQKAVDQATENLGKVQTGAMDFHKAMEFLDEAMKDVEALKAVAPNRAEKYFEELTSTRHWTRKFAPLIPPSPPATPATPPPATDPTPAPTPDPTPDPDPDPTPTPATPEPAEPAWVPPDLPEKASDRAAALLPLLGDTALAARAWACAQVPFSPNKPTVDALFGLLFDDPSPDVRAAAAKAITDTRHDAVYEAFGRLAEDLPEEKLEVLVELMKDKPEPRTVEALFAVAMRFVPPIGGANSQDKGAMYAYQAKAKATWEDGWRHRIIQIWRSWPEPLVSEGFGVTWKSQKKKGRKGLKFMQEILLAVGVIGNHRGIRHAVPFLTQGKEPASPLRAPALCAIEMVGKPAVPWLIQGLTSPQTNLWCWQALYNITGENRGRKAMAVGRWLEWWNENR